MGHQASLSMELSRQDTGSGLPFPTLGNLCDSVIGPISLAPPSLAGGFFTIEPPGKPLVHHYFLYYKMFLSGTINSNNT